MENNTNAAATVRNESYSKLVQEARELARTALRTRNIRTQVEAKSELNREKDNLLKGAKAGVEAATHLVEKATYQLAKKNLESNLGDPDFKSAVKSLQENLDAANKDLVKANEYLTAISDGTNADIVAINKEIALCDKKILGWENGENKVQLANLNKLASEYIEKALNEKARALSSLVA